MMFLLSATIALLCCALIVSVARTSSWGVEPVVPGAQKFHRRPTPRTGGVAIYVAVGVASLTMGDADAIALWLSGGVAFAGGLAEDISHRVRPRWRLFLTFVSATLAFLIVDAQLRRIGVVGLNELLSWSVIAALLLTTFAVGGVAHAVNIVDGYNGLMIGICLIASAAFGIVGWKLQDMLIVQLCLLGAGASLGFFAMNFPYGKIFCGDGGAYFLGFWLAEIAVLLVARNDSVSPWLCFMILFYPIVETLFSMYRKKVLRRMSPGVPDGLHLHMLVYKKLIRRRLRGSRWSPAIQNALTAPLLWLFAALPGSAALWFWDNTPMLLALLAVCSASYLWIYWRLVAVGR